VQLVAFVVFQVSVDALPITTVAGVAVKVIVGAGAAMETVADWLALPPGPLQLKVKVVITESAPVDWLPLVALAPVQPPSAVQLVALVELQVSVAEPPLATVVGDAVSVTVGADEAATETVTDWLPEPPGPAQVRVNVVVALSAPVDWLPLVARAPLQPPLAVQPVALVELQVSVADSPLAIEAGAALSVTAGTGDVTVTVTVRLLVPPGPVHVNVKSDVAFSAAVGSLPLTAFAPDHASEAVQLVAFVALQVSVDAWPLVTVAGFAVRVIAGAGVLTVTVTLLLALPPGPVQERLNVVVEVSAPLDCVPLTAFAPLHPPLAEQLVASVDDHVSVDDWPLAIESGSAARVTVGAGGVTATDVVATPVPPGPVQLSVNAVVEVSGPLDWLPLVALLPDQPPEAVQLVAFVELQVRVAEAPLATLEGDAVMVTSGAGCWPTDTVTDSARVPPSPVQVSVKTVLLVIGPVEAVPLVALVPDHPPEAVQDFAEDANQESVADCPLVTDAGLAPRVTSGGGGVTFTGTVWLAEPPAPLQVSVKAVPPVSAPVDALPLSGFEPLQPPEATQDVALAEVQFNVDADPLTTVAGLALSDTDGWGGGGTPTATVTVWLISPPGPAQLNVNAVEAASTPVEAVPFTGRAPVHPPEAVQELALVVVQERFDC
jgi:hypothetical protein